MLTFDDSPAILQTVKTPPSGLTSTEAWHGARLVRALLITASDYVREFALPDSVALGALGSALGSVSAAVVRKNGYDLAAYEELITRHVAHVLRTEVGRVTHH